MIRNKYKVDGDIVNIFCNNDVIAKVSLGTFNEKVKDFTVQWFAKFDVGIKNYYIQCSKYIGNHKNSKTMFFT